MSARQQARAAGAVHYVTGKACKHGHVSARFTSNGSCIACWDVHVAANRPRLLGYYRDRYTAEKPAILRQQRERHRANPEAKREQTRQWQAANPERVRGYKRRNKHRRRAAVGDYSRRDIEALLRIQRSECAGCACSIVAGFHVDHVIPLARGGANYCGNLQLLCKPCNLTKSDRLPIEWRRARRSP